MVANTIDDLLKGPTEISWMLFEHVEPILREYLENGRVLSIDDVFRQKGKKSETHRREAEDRVVERATAWINEGIEDLYGVQGFFDREMRKAEEPRPTDTHMYTTYGEFHRGFTEHARRMIKTSNLPRRIVNALTPIIDFNPEATGINLSRSVYLGMRHGSLKITDMPSYPVIFQVSRIKDPKRMGNKFARYVCEGILEWRTMQSYLNGNEVNKKERDRKIAEGLNELLRGNKDEKKMAGKIVENFGAMYAHELQTPFSEDEILQIGEEGIDPFEYILMRCRVSDILGNMDVVRNDSEMRELMERTKNGRFVGENNYSVLFGKRLRKEGREWGYVNDFIVDDQGRRLFTYACPRRRVKKHNIRIDLGLEALENYADDAVGGERSHIIHEARQEGKVREWSRDMQRLYYALSHTVSFPLERLDMKKYEVYKGFAFQRGEARAK